MKVKNYLIEKTGISTACLALGTFSCSLYSLADDLNRNGINLDYINTNAATGCGIALIILNILYQNYFSVYSQKRVEEYKIIKNIYDQIITNIAEFIKKIGANDPVSAYVVFNYMVKYGFLSYNHKCVYNQGKDIQCLFGADVVRGEAVCRNFASILSNVYDKMGFDTSVLSVHSNRYNSKYMISKTELPILENKFDKKILSVLEKYPLSNHLITQVSDGTYNYVFDCTGDGSLEVFDSSNLNLFGDKNAKMKYSIFQTFTVIPNNNIGLMSI